MKKVSLKKSFNLILIATIFVLFMDGCSRHKRLKVPYKKRVYKERIASYEQRGGYNTNPYALVDYSQNGRLKRDSYRGRYQQRVAYPTSNRVYRDNPPLKIATNVNEIDAQARATQPMYIASQPLRIPSDVRFMNLSTYRNVMVNIINRTRASNLGGYPGTDVPAYWNRFLTKAAEAHARDMAVHKFISHLGSGDRTDYARKAPGQGSNFYERIIFYGYPAQPGNRAGEILTVTKDSIVGTKEIMPHFQHAIENFLKSPKHSYVLKNPRLNRVGIAAYRSGRAIYWVIELVEERS